MHTIKSTKSGPLTSTRCGSRSNDENDPATRISCPISKLDVAYRCHRKLDNFKFVIHGGIDGNSRLITFMRVCDNNRADSVTHACQEGAKLWGWPQRVRADYGKELLGVRKEMLERRGKHATACFRSID
jgi:hypothetical protein